MRPLFFGGPPSSQFSVSLFLINYPLYFNPTPTFLGVTFDRTLFCSCVFAKSQVLPHLKALLCFSATSWGSFKESLALYKVFSCQLSQMLHANCFHLSVLPTLLRWNDFTSGQSRQLPAASHIPSLSKASLRVALTHNALLWCERTLCLPIYTTSDLAKLGVKFRLFRSTWRVFASTHPLMLSPSCPKEALSACLPSPPRNPPSFIVDLTLSTPCSRSYPPLSGHGWLSLPPHDLVICTDGFFPFAKDGSNILPNCSLCGTEATLSYSAGPVCLSFSAETCAILQALRWSRQHQQVCHFSPTPTLSSLPSFLLPQTLWDI